jgi:copper oxidase (laccase) domain-containing protein
LREADGLVSPGRVAGGAPVGCLVITVADCMPIFLFDSGTGAFGLLHSGWKGTGILAEAVRVMGRLYGTKPADVSAVLGPRIGACCYVVDEARAAEFSGEFGAAAVVRADGRPRLDLVAANLAIADALGLGAVDVMDGCTSCDARFGSFRRQGAGRFTRMAAAIGYPAADS